MRPRTFLAPSGRGVRWQPGSVARITALVTPPQNDRFGTAFAITLPERRAAPIGGTARGYPADSAALAAWLWSGTISPTCIFMQRRLLDERPHLPR